ncbi:uncharacterized protein CBL_01180 [Carabus blaptoides fortunei]
MFSEEKKEVYGVETLYRELGCYLKTKKQYAHSLQPFAKAVEVTPKDLRTLCSRSWCFAKCANYPCALKDINNALDAHPEDIPAMQLKAHYTYLNTDFESAMVINYRGIDKRKQPDLFAKGVMQCIEETERCIGKRGARALRDHYDMIRAIAWEKALKLRKGFQPQPRFKQKKKRKQPDIMKDIYFKFRKKALAEASKIAEKKSELRILESLTDTRANALHIAWKPKSKHQPPQNRTYNIDNCMGETYLGKMFYDKQFLDAMKTDPRVNCPNDKGARQINNLAKQGFKKLVYRQELLRARKPFYSIKYAQIEAKEIFLRHEQEELKELQKTTKIEIENSIKRLELARSECHTDLSIHLANRVKSYIDRLSLKALPNKEMYLKEIYDLIGLAFLEAYRINDAISEPESIKRVNYMFGVSVGAVPSEDSVIKENRREYMSVKNCILERIERLKKATTPLEGIWLYYDIARFSLNLKKLDHCRFYAQMSSNLACILDNYVWACNASMLIVSSYVLQHDRNNASQELAKTTEYATKLQHSEMLHYIDKCAEVIDVIEIEDIPTSKIISDREGEIVAAIVGMNVQKDVQLLFKRMSAIPISRRMSIMPGFPMEDDTKSVVSRKSSGKPTITAQSRENAEFKAHDCSCKCGIKKNNVNKVVVDT